MTLAGIVIGLGAAFGLSRYVTSQIYGVEPANAALYAASALVLAGVAMVAAFVPAWRAARIDPIRALRYE